MKILFCGSDVFSATSLEALHEYKESGKSNISTIDVVTKTDKRTGRGLKKLTSPTIKPTALSYGLPLHQIDTFTGWTPPDTNLIIAVSFGLLIPSRVIRGSKYGGLNVHPSLLPDLRGAAPIEWSIVHGRKHTGISIQTLHETKFDHGVVLDRSEKIDMPEYTTVHQLKASLAPIASEMLVNAVHNRLYLPPYESIVETSGQSKPAPKIKNEHKAVNFKTMTSEEIVRRFLALGLLYAFVKADGKKRRVNFTTQPYFPMAARVVKSTVNEISVGVPYVLVPPDEGDLMQEGRCRELRVKTIDDKELWISKMTIEGKPMAMAATAAARAHLLTEGMELGNRVLYKFKAPLTAT